MHVLWELKIHGLDMIHSHQDINLAFNMTIKQQRRSLRRLINFQVALKTSMEPIKVPRGGGALVKIIETTCDLKIRV